MTNEPAKRGAYSTKLVEYNSKAVVYKFVRVEAYKLARVVAYKFTRVAVYKLAKAVVCKFTKEEAYNYPETLYTNGHEIPVE